jgi:hypothetical protein
MDKSKRVANKINRLSERREKNANIILDNSGSGKNQGRAMKRFDKLDAKISKLAEKNKISSPTMKRGGQMKKKK